MKDRVPHLGVRLGGVAWYLSTSWLLALSACFSSVAANAWAVARVRAPSTASATARHLCTHTQGELPRLQRQVAEWATLRLEWPGQQMVQTCVQKSQVAATPAKGRSKAERLANPLTGAGGEAAEHGFSQPLGICAAGASWQGDSAELIDWLTKSHAAAHQQLPC